MKLINSPRHPALISGEPNEWADDPTRVNRQLFGWQGDWFTLPQSVNHHPKLLRVEIATEPQVASFGTRIIIPLRIWMADGRVIYQPFYRSSGMATPEASPKGTWWPTSGLYTREYCAARGHKGSDVGYIGKHFRLGGEWYHHGKKVDHLPRPLQTIAVWLSELI